MKSHIKTPYGTALLVSSLFLSLTLISRWSEQLNGINNFVIPNTQVAQVSESISGLVGLWKFDEGNGTAASDSSSYSNTSTLTNGSTWTTGKFGQALNLDGIKNYSTSPPSSALNLTGDMSMGGWIYFNALWPVPQISYTEVAYI